MNEFDIRDGRNPADWAGFLVRPRVEADPELAKSVAGGKSVLITGAGGSIGSGLARAMILGEPRTLVLLDLSEGGLSECYRHILRLGAAARVSVIPVTGSVVDGQLLDRLLQQHKIELVLHAAAYKHVPLMELNPFSAILNNSIGTYRLVCAARRCEVSRLTMVSTDKAVNPRSIMGASKRIAELAVLAYPADDPLMNVIRLGNVLGSSGSVVPIFQEQLESGLPLTVTDPEATRYFMTPAEAESAILLAAGIPVSGRVMVPDCGDARRVVDLARYLETKSSASARLNSKIEYIGLRPGDKVSEELLSEPEEVVIQRVNGMRIADGPHMTASAIASAMIRLEQAVDSFDLQALIATVSELVPSYRTSQLLKQEYLLPEAL